MTPWLGTPTSYASGYINAHRVVSSVPSGPWPPTFQSLTVELSSPPTYWMGLLTRSSRGSRALNSDSPGIPPWYVGLPRTENTANRPSSTKARTRRGPGPSLGGRRWRGGDGADGDPRGGAARATGRLPPRRVSAPRRHDVADARGRRPPGHVAPPRGAAAPPRPG